jgi:peptidyl-prolyl cis-trans isomerase A (cyclophilin A)
LRSNVFARSAARQNSAISAAALSIIFALFAPRIHACDSPDLKSPDQGKATVRFQTTLGRIDIQIDLRRAPRTACNFLKNAARTIYDGGNFGRTVRPDNQRGNSVPISVIQAYPNPSRAPDAVGPIALERTKGTGMQHRNGTVSMARGSADDAVSEFFICVGSQPELDYGGHRNPDGQGFAAFGRVVRGMGVVRRILMSRAVGEKLNPPILIESAKLLSQ